MFNLKLLNRLLIIYIVEDYVSKLLGRTFSDQKNVAIKLFLKICSSWLTVHVNQMYLDVL